MYASFPHESYTHCNVYDARKSWYSPGDQLMGWRGIIRHRNCQYFRNSRVMGITWLKGWGVTDGKGWRRGEDRRGYIWEGLKNGGGGVEDRRGYIREGLKKRGVQTVRVEQRRVWRKEGVPAVRVEERSWYIREGDYYTWSVAFLDVVRCSQSFMLMCSLKGGFFSLIKLYNTIQLVKSQMVLFSDNHYHTHTPSHTLTHTHTHTHTLTHTISHTHTITHIATS